MNAERQPLLDYIKGIGIALVVYGHVARGVVKAGLPFDQQLFEQLDAAIYSFHMPLFFFVSGVLFFASFARRGRAEFMLSKLQTVAYPYLLWSILQGVLEVVLSRWTNGGVSLSEVFALLWRPRAQFWFLYVLFFVFLVASIVYSLRNKVQNRIVLALAILLYLSAWSPLDLYATNMFGQWFVFFALGAALPSAIAALGERAWIFPIFAALFLATFAVLPQIAGKEFGMAMKLALALLGVASVIGAAGWAMRLGQSWLAMLGRHSLEIYLLHILVGSGVRIVLQKFMGVTNPAVHLLVGTFFGLGVSLWVAVTIKKYGGNWMFAAPRLKSAVSSK